MTRVVEFVEVVKSQARRESKRIDRQVNKWISKQENSRPGYKLVIQDVKYHTQYRKEQDDMVHSVLIIWDWKKDHGDGGGGGRTWAKPPPSPRKHNPRNPSFYEQLEDEFRGVSFSEPRKPHRDLDRYWYSTPDKAWKDDRRRERR